MMSIRNTCLVPYETVQTLFRMFGGAMSTDGEPGRFLLRGGRSQSDPEVRSRADADVTEGKQPFPAAQLSGGENP